MDSDPSVSFTTRLQAALALRDRAAARLADQDGAGARDAALVAVGALEAVVGPKHFEIAGALDLLAAALAQLGRPGDALAHWRRAAALLPGTPGAGAAAVVRVPVFCNYGDALMRHGAYAEAEGVLRRAAQDAVRVFGSGSVALARCNALRGRLARLQGRWAEARSFYRRAHRAHARSGAPIPPELQEDLAGLGDVEARAS